MGYARPMSPAPPPTSSLLPSTSSLSEAEAPSLSLADRDALVALLEQCPAISSRNTRDRIAVRLHEQANIDITHSETMRVHVDNIVTTCNNHFGGLAALLAALRHFDQRHTTTEGVVDFLAERGLVGPSPTGPGKASDARGPCPYPGMMPLTEQALFFGRDRESARLVHHVRDHALTVLVGPSGVGKSSLIQAGLLPHLPPHWPVCQVRLGATPLASLRQALGVEPVYDSDSDDIIAAAVAALLAHPGDNVDDDARVVVVVDPFEELFQAATILAAAHNTDQACGNDVESCPNADPETDPGGQRQINGCYRLLAALAAHPRCYPVLVLRADFYGDFMHCPLWPLSQHSRIELGPLSGPELRDAITEPAARRGVIVEPDLVERLLADAARQPGTLPLLQATLRELWHKLGPGDSRLQLVHYRDVGAPVSSGDGDSGPDDFASPLEALLARKADAALAALAPLLQPLALPLLLRLIQFGQGRADTRRRQRLTKLADLGPRADVEAVVLHLAQHRLLTVTGEGPDARALAGTDAASVDLDDTAAPGDQRGVDLAHEAIIRAWPVLRCALAEHRVAEETRRRLEAKARDYQRHDRRGGLLDAVALDEVETWLASAQARYLGASPELRSLAQASRNALNRARYRRRAAMIAMAALTLLTALAAAIAWQQRGRAEDRHAEAQRHRDLALDVQHDLADAPSQPALITMLQSCDN